MLLQEYWKQNLDWDDTPSDELAKKWSAFLSQISRLDEIVIPRWTHYRLATSSVTLHGFSDASSNAYAACVYLVVLTPSADPIAHLLLAKTKVAPLQTISIPRLELCGALLLAKCMELAMQSLPITLDSLHCWTDSSVVLGWLRKSPSSLKTFVANRIADIQTRLPQAQWRHIPTMYNPADCASRGIQPDELRDHPLWWHGPSFLRNETSDWPDQSPFLNIESSLDVKQPRCSALQACTSDSLQVEYAVSTWPRLIRVTAYMYRFVRRARYPDVVHREEALQVGEIQQAHHYVIKRVQAEYFATEISTLSKGQSLPNSCGLLSLDPFLDPVGILRVGDRLRHSDLPSGQQRPILVPPSRIADILIDQAHRDTLHGGTQVTLRVLRKRYWIVGARSKVRAFIHTCSRCVRYAARTPTQLISDLPRPRVSVSRPFDHTGVDYAGPVQMRTSSGRGHRAHKAYLAIFVCLAVRAVHLELVHDYSSSAFLAAFDRFVARRGYPHTMYSDNGTTFRGADADLRAAFQQATSEPDVLNRLSTRGVAWQFVPPSAPHFGGLWEAGVKSLKHHLRRVLGNSTPTVEELLTLLCNIEATLNSRPIAPLHDDVGSYDALTPGHFLVGTTLKSVPRPTTLNLQENRMSRWQQIQHKTEQFWRLWASDYLNCCNSVKNGVREAPMSKSGIWLFLRIPCFHRRSGSSRASANVTLMRKGWFAPSECVPRSRSTLDLLTECVRCFVPPMIASLCKFALYGLYIL